jgi:sterol-4alpha-carboxylate 3-dehydrogenase (decarboxylating)
MQQYPRIWFQPGPVLVIGGCGFIGCHIVQHFVDATDFPQVFVLSRSALHTANKVDGAIYLAGDLRDRASIVSALEQSRPAVIIHAASPSPITGTPKEYQNITVDGTKTLLELALASEDVRVLIYTSSSTMAKGREHLNVDEEAPLADTDAKAPAYARTKAIAERAVLQANNPLTDEHSTFRWNGHLCTAALRFPICYGTHDTMLIPGALAALQEGRTGFQLGDGKNIWDFCSTENVGAAHVLLARRLPIPDSEQLQIAGKAFNIHDGQSRPFWDLPKTIWRLAGHKPSREEVTQIPVWFASTLAVVLEFLFWMFTFGTKRPGNMGKQQVEYSCFTHTYDISKARKILGYEPKHKFEEEMAKAVAWSLQQDGWAKKLNITRDSAL